MAYIVLVLFLTFKNFESYIEVYLRDSFKSFQWWSDVLKTPTLDSSEFNLSILAWLCAAIDRLNAVAKISACSSDSASIIIRLFKSPVAISMLVGEYLGFFGRDRRHSQNEPSIWLWEIQNNFFERKEQLTNKGKVNWAAIWDARMIGIELQAQSPDRCSELSILITLDSTYKKCLD